ncbi:MAG TPA: DUF2807 domain-containing protein [Rhizomicrobium sp.]|jgi:hypothetical protein
MKSLLLLASAATLFATSALAGETLNVGPFRTVQLRGGGQVTIHQGDQQRVTLNAGSTRYTSFTIDRDGTLVIDACNNSCPNGEYDLRIDIATPDIHGVAVDGGGDIVATSDFSSHRVGAAVNGGGTIDMRAVRADSVNAAVNGGGKIKVYAAGDLHAAVSGGGLIEYWGNPKVRSAVSGGGDVRQGS